MADNREHEIKKALNFFHPVDGETFELCGINPKQNKCPAVFEGFAKSVVAGWYSDKAKAAKDAAALDRMGCEGIYITLNPTTPALLGRANNRLIGGISRTQDKEVPVLRNMLIDIDPDRPKGISSTNDEHRAAIAHGTRVRSELTERGWPEPMFADSGNGAHLIYQLPGLTNSAENVELVKMTLYVLDFLFSQSHNTGQLKVDVSVFNSSRLVKLYGTTARKGDSVPGREHRLARTLKIPTHPNALSAELMRDLLDHAKSEGYVPEGAAATTKKHAPPSRSEVQFAGDFDLGGYLRHYGVQIVKQKAHQGGMLHCLQECIFDSSHNGNEAAIFEAGDGKLSYQCFHDSCKSRTWHDARQIISGTDNLAQFCKFPNSRTVRTVAGRLPDSKNNSEIQTLDGSDGWDGSKEEKCNFLSAVPGFPVHVFDECYQEAVIEHAEAFNVPVDIPSIALLATGGACIGRTRGLIIKDGWVEYANTYLGIVGRSGTGKSPVINSIRRYIYTLEAQWFAEYQKKLKEHNEVIERRKSLSRKERVNLYPLADPPKYTQLIIDDSTIESVTDALDNNPRGVQWARDELAGLMFELDKYTGREGGSKPRLMSAYDSGPWKINRIGRNKFIPKACLSIFGTIQDKALPSIFSSMDAATGFLPRFNFVRVEQDRPPLWTDKVVSGRSNDTIKDLYEELLGYSFTKDNEPVFVGIKRSAQKLYIDWYNQQAIEPWGDCEASIYEAVLAKLRGQCLRFGLILHCMDSVASGRSEREPMSVDTMTRALILADYLKAHQKSVWELCFKGSKTIQLKPFERRIAQAIIDLQGDIKSGMLSTSTITTMINHDQDARFHVKPESVGKAFKGMGIESGHLPDKTGRGAKITSEILENLKKALGNRPNRPNRPSVENQTKKTEQLTVREPSQPSGNWQNISDRVEVI